MQLLLSSTGEPANPDTFKYTYLYDSSILDYYDKYSPNSGADQQTLLEANKKYLELVKKGRRLSTSFHRSAISASLYYQSFDLFSAVTLLNRVNYPKIKTVTSFGDQIVDANKTLYTQLEKNHKIIYTHLIELLEERMADLRQASGTLQDYLDNAGIPIQTCKDIPYFPGFLIHTEDGKALLVEMKKPLKRIKAYTESGKEKFKCAVTYHSPTGGDMDSRSGNLTIKNGRLTLTAAGLRHPVFSQDLP